MKTRPDPSKTPVVKGHYPSTSSCVGQQCAHDNPRMISTARYIEERLGVDGFLRRYPPGGSYDGIQDAENLFAVCTFWLAEYLARLGKIDDAKRSFERLLERATDLGLYAEEFDARTKRAAGNFPQAFTHVELIRTALSLEAASRTQQSAKKKSS